MKKAKQNRICLTVPPKDLIIADFYSLLDSVQLRTNELSEKLLLMQTIQGHANMAHGMFRTHDNYADCIKYPNATLEDIASALSNDRRLKMDSSKIKQIRYEIVMDIRNLMHDIIKGKKVRKIYNPQGEPINGVTFFKDFEIKNPENVLKGFYLGSIMDNYVIWRKQIEKEPYGLEMGGGECVAVNMRRLNQDTFNKMVECDESLAMEFIDKCSNGFHLGVLANEEWGKHIDILYKYGVIVINNKNVVRANKHIRSAYVRHKKGKGVSDNAAIVMAGKIYGQKDIQDGIEVALGVFLADTVDTLDKFLPYIHKSGLDEQIGNEILESNKLKMTEREKLNFIFFSAIHPRKKMPDCSQRYFLEIDSKTGDTAIENHLTYLHGGKYNKMFFGNKNPLVRVSSEDFYQTIEESLEKYGHLL